MPAITSIFNATDPFQLVRDWVDEAAETEPSDPNAMQLATVDAVGLPNVRTVLLKEIEDDAFVWYTNYDSAKGQEIAHAGTAAFVIHWKTLGRQVRARGPVEREDGAQADAYYRSRPLDSRLGAWASEQSRPLEDRFELMRRVEAARAEHGDDPDRPPFWGGFRLRPVEIEFWVDGENRLHDRERWRRGGPAADWTVKRLYP